MSNNETSGRAFPAKLAASGVLLVLLVIFWAENRGRVKVNYFGFTTHTRIWVALAVSGAIGFLIGLLVARHGRD